MSEQRTPQQRDAAAIRIYPPLAPVAAIIAGTLLDKIWPLRPGPVDPAQEPVASVLAWVGGATLAVAAAGALWAFWIMRRSGQNPDPRAPTPAIVDHGPFRFSRNPIYLQMVLFCVGFAIRKANVWLLLLTPVTAWMLQKWVILPEETYLEHKFGEAYLAYKRRVRRWL